MKLVFWFSIRTLATVHSFEKSRDHLTTVVLLSRVSLPSKCWSCRYEAVSEGSGGRGCGCGEEWVRGDRVD